MQKDIKNEEKHLEDIKTLELQIKNLKKLINEKCEYNTKL
jgi:hypothetical protein